MGFLLPSIDVACRAVGTGGLVNRLQTLPAMGTIFLSPCFRDRFHEA